MKNTTSVIPGTAHSQYPAKLRLQRTRTCSSDSGCDVVCDSPDLTATIMEDCIQTWEVRLEGVVGQEMERAREVTNWAKEALRHASEDEAKRQETLESWRSQLESIMEFTKDLIECVNNDTKEVMYDSMGLSSGHESTSTIEEIEEENDDKEEEIMQLFLLSAMGQSKKEQKRGTHGNKSLMKEFISIDKKNKKSFKNSRKATKEVQRAYSKIKSQASLAKQRNPFEEAKRTKDIETKDDFMFSQKVFDDGLDSAEIFNDWHWNLNEKKCYENTFSDWQWNCDIQADLKVKYYDDPEIKHEWNEFNFWKINDRSNKIDHDNGIVNDGYEDKVWTNCVFWQNIDDNENIAHSLVDDIIEDNGNKEILNFWDENTANQSILESLIVQKEKAYAFKNTDDDDFLWEAKDTVMTLIDIETVEKTRNGSDYSEFIWNDLETIDSLLKSDDDEESDMTKSEDVFHWEDPEYIKSLFLIEEKTDLISFSDESMFGLNDETEQEDESKDWTNWTFWNDFGTVPDIIDAYEQILRLDITDHLNIQDVFWEISMERRRLCHGNYRTPWSGDPSTKSKQSKNTPKDPANIFRSFKHVFSVPMEMPETNVSSKEFEENHVFDNMEDVYEDWASVVLSDKRSENKKRIWKRKKEKHFGGSNKENKSNLIVGQRRPGTPTIHTATTTTQNEHFDFNSCWIETKVPKKERKVAHVWKNAKSKKRLSVKMYAKQPRSIM